MCTAAANRGLSLRLVFTKPLLQSLENGTLGKCTCHKWSQQSCDWMTHSWSRDSKAVGLWCALAPASRQAMLEECLSWQEPRVLSVLVCKDNPGSVPNSVRISLLQPLQFCGSTQHIQMDTTKFVRINWELSGEVKRPGRELTISPPHVVE